MTRDGPGIIKGTVEVCAEQGADVIVNYLASAGVAEEPGMDWDPRT